MMYERTLLTLSVHVQESYSSHNYNRLIIQDNQW